MNTIRTLTLICIFSLSFIQIYSQESISERVTKNWEIVQSDTTSEERLRGYFWTLYYAQFSGKKEIEKYQKESSKILPNCLSDLCQYWNNNITAINANFEGDYEKATTHYKLSIDLGEKLGDSVLIIKNYNLLAHIYQAQDKFVIALEYWQIVKGYYETKDGKNSLSDVLNNLGVTNDLMGNPEKAIELYDQVIAMKDEINEGNYLSALYNKALVYDYYGQKKKALITYHQVLEVAEKQDNKEHIGVNYFNIGSVNKDLRDYENALKYYNKANKVFEGLNDKVQLVQVCLGLGELHNELRNFDKAIRYFNKGFGLANEINHNYYKAAYTIGLGNALMAQEIDKKQPEWSKQMRYLEIAQSKTLSPAVIEEAYSYHKIAYDIGVNNNYPHIIGPAATGLGKNYFYRQEPKMALKYLYEALNAGDSNILNKMRQKLFIAFAESQIGNNKVGFNALCEGMVLKDSIYNIEKIQEGAKIQADFEFEKEKEVLAAQKKADEAVLKAETTQTRTAAAGIGLLAILGFAFFWNARRKNNIISQQNQQLEELNITKDRIFAIIGHDLRKPAIGFRNVTKKVNYLLQNQDYKTLSALGNSIEKDALALNKLTDNLLSWALTQKDVMPYNPTALPLRELTDEVISVFRPLGEEKGIAINNDISEDLEVYADLNSLQAIIRNLVDNGIKYSNQGGEINLTAVSTDEGVKIEIADNGIGMNEEKLRDIFLLKKEKSQKGTQGEKGTGLGLHLVQELVKLNKGLISVKSELGLGTNFEVVLLRVA